VVSADMGVKLLNKILPIKMAELVAFGDGNQGGVGGNGHTPPDPNDDHLVGHGGDGGYGGHGGQGGNGGVGGSLSLTASNGFVYVDSFFDVWVNGGDGGQGGDGGVSGNGGDGGTCNDPNPTISYGGDGGQGGDGGVGGIAGDGGTITILAAKVYTNFGRVNQAMGGGLQVAFGGAGGQGGMGGYGGTGSIPEFNDGTPGNQGSPGTDNSSTSGNPGNYTFDPDVIPPVLASSDPATEPAAGSGINFTYSTNLIWNLSVFTDVFTEQKCLRHTIQIVNTNAPSGAATSTITNDLYNIAANTNILFTVLDGWQNQGYYFRFLTFDKADNVTTNLYPGQTDNYFEVVPEPVTFLIFNLLFLIYYHRK